MVHSRRVTDVHDGARTPAWYAAPIARFLAAAPEQILGHLAAESPFDVTPAQRDAWQREIVVLRSALTGMGGWLLLEFDIPRLGSRVDAVVLTGSSIIPIEFKVGEREYLGADYNQAWDYALDLKNFHSASDRVPNPGAGTRLGVCNVGCGPALHWAGMAAPILQREGVAVHPGSLAPAVPGQCLSRTAYTSPTGDGDLRATWRPCGSNPSAGVLRRDLRLPAGGGSAGGRDVSSGD